MYKIILDSCGELTEEMKKDGHFVNVPLTLEIDEQQIIDDDSFDQASFIKAVAESPNAPKSACPSPNAYMVEMDCDAENVYVVTLSAQLSGSYNSACLGKDLYEEDDESKNIHVFDSKSASIGETLIALKIAECENAGMSFEQVIEAVDAYIENQHTFFVLETLETFRKSGRLSGLKAAIAETLNIKPVMGSTDTGYIQQLAKGRGMNQTIDKMTKCVMDVTTDCENKILAISHCNCPDRALTLKKKMESLATFKDIFIVDMRGVSTMYANDGGVILVV
ncbi:MULTISPECIES: DegV family protein [Pseudobutyrivibrio]|uniref:EDD domain protein, DegV family n=1 Tax=Pseudobutyrivibrio xylanivorans TaxID=185007 RepID=A0A1G5S4S3_PSEXY|nr:MULTISPECIES: DegV family protein [Pseudobutyrivibrio]MDC7280627.1 DegV family protein [Butyrivibrio fibrisolvens]SCZ80840.1 EDD domain protein, DegV family [Pseudobutyrivibrio xylanivorans]